MMEANEVKYKKLLFGYMRGEFSKFHSIPFHSLILSRSKVFERRSGVRAANATNEARSEKNLIRRRQLYRHRIIVVLDI